MIGAAAGLVSHYNPAMEERPDYNRIRWQSRRGMLELDLVLEPFVTHRYRQLSERDQGRYRDLLECEDQDLFAWLLGRTRPRNEGLAAIVDTILHYTRSQG